LVLGGLLTQYASWRWTLLINVPIAIAAAVAATREIRESKAEGQRRYDLPGAALVTGGLLALVYGFTRAETAGWGAPITVSLLAGGALLLAGFVLVESRSSAPLLPLRVVLDRNRGGSFMASLLVGISLMGTFLFLTYYLQGTLHYSALKSGFAFLPFSGGIIVSAILASQLLPRFGPRVLMSGGLMMAALGLAWFTQIGLHTTYGAHVLPAELVVSIGLGFVFVPFSSTALIGVAPRDAGVASALVNATQQVGGSLGTALLNTVAASATLGYLTVHHGALAPALGAVHGYTTGFVCSAAVLALAMVLAATLVRATRHDLRPADMMPIA
jgi:MFS family permease